MNKAKQTLTAWSAKFVSSNSSITLPPNDRRFALILGGDGTNDWRFAFGTAAAGPLGLYMPVGVQPIKLTELEFGTGIQDAITIRGPTAAGGITITIVEFLCICGLGEQ